jgi:hypothetical protein
MTKHKYTKNKLHTTTNNQTKRRVFRLRGGNDPSKDDEKGVLDTVRESLNSSIDTVTNYLNPENDSANMDESKEDSANMDESKEDSTNMDESKEDSANMDESKEDSANMDESKEDSANMDESEHKSLEEKLEEILKANIRSLMPQIMGMLETHQPYDDATDMDDDASDMDEASAVQEKSSDMDEASAVQEKSSDMDEANTNSIDSMLNR